MNRLLAVANPAIPAILVLGLFVWFANWIPQTRWQPPEKRVIESASSPAQLAELGKTILMVTHDPEAAGHAQKIIHLDKGRLGRIEDNRPAAAEARD